ncbi:hypothetical protein SK128_020789, partial [Halocaridina rubra]
VDCLDAKDESICRQRYTVAPSSTSTSELVNTPGSTSTSELVNTPESSTSSVSFSPSVSSSSSQKPPTNREDVVNGSEDSEGGYDNSYNLLTIKEEPDVICYIDQFRCSVIGQCLSWDSVCDGVRHCKDGSDEIGCTCTDRLLKFRPEFDCDGYPDCFDLSDENCKPCGEDFVCPQSRMCVPRTAVCDAVTDCTYGEDEINC